MTSLDLRAVAKSFGTTAVLRGLVGERPLAPAVDRLLDGGATSGRATALGLCTAIDLVERTTRVR